MGSHLGAIGFPSGSLQQQIERLIPHSSQLGESDDGLTRVIAHEDASGSRVVITLEQDVIVCLTPTFRPGQTLAVSVSSMAPNECPYERPLIVEILGDDLGEYPLAIQIEDLALGDERFVPGSRAQLEVAALAETITIFPDETAYYASGTAMSSRSVIPSGLFAPPGSPEEDSFSSSPRMLMQGIVTSSDLLQHSVLRGSFVRMTVNSHAATFEVLAGARDLADTSGTLMVPAPGAVVSGQFWLSGRLLAGA
ncbi:hypothetical protein BH20CHL6_BH20CHL6_14270 [soil metagenome]